ESIAAYERELPRIEVVLRMRRDALPRLAEVVGRRHADVAIASATDDGNGALRLRLTYEDLDEASGPILRLGGDAEVTAPEELRTRVLQTAQGIVRAYEAEPLSAPAPRRPIAVVPPAARPGRAPVCRPLSTTGTPLTMTCSMPSGKRFGCS